MKNFKDVVEVVKAHKAEIVKGLLIGGVTLGLGLVLSNRSDEEDFSDSPEDEDTTEDSFDGERNDEAPNDKEESID